MTTLDVTPEHMEVLAAIAETAGIGSDFPGVLEFVESDVLVWMVKKAQDVVGFRDAVVCEGQPQPESIPAGQVTKDLISLEFDDERIEETRTSMNDLASRYTLETIHPATLLFQALFPDRQRIVELTQIASESPDLAGLDSHIRMQRLVELHPRNRIKE